MFCFQAARNMLPGRTEEAIRTLEGATCEGDEAIAESRDAIQGPRADPALAKQSGVSAHCRRKGTREIIGEPPAFRVIVEGARQPLSPQLQDDIHRIAREVLRNAFQHACAHRIEAAIQYDPDLFRLRIRDDGKGWTRRF
jgi:signal transduction histidine kinase